MFSHSGQVQWQFPVHLAVVGASVRDEGPEAPRVAMCSGRGRLVQAADSGTVNTVHQNMHAFGVESATSEQRRISQLKRTVWPTD